MAMMLLPSLKSCRIKEPFEEHVKCVKVLFSFFDCRISGVTPVPIQNIPTPVKHPAY
jgi:hypothetical protein